jgi:photosystem I subunit 3
MKRNILSKFLLTFALLSFIGIFGIPEQAKADLNQLTPCKDSIQFHKRLDNTIKKYEGRLKKYDANTQPAQNLKTQIERTKVRFLKYEQEGLLCGKEGLPHLVADGRFNHAKEFVLPGLLFIYITGWIGWVGRKYILYSATTTSPTEKEILLDVPYALKSMSTGFIWPLEAWQEFTNGELLASDDEITVSPR